MTPYAGGACPSGRPAASSAILPNFPRFNKMKGMGQIATWSARDAPLRCASIIRLYKTFLTQTPDLGIKAIENDLYEARQKIPGLETAFIHLAFEAGDAKGLSAGEAKASRRYTANLRPARLGVTALFDVRPPSPWLDAMLNAAERANFFENRAGGRARAAIRGIWEEAFAPA